MRRLVPLLALSLAACTQFPELDARLTEADRTAPYPALVPLAPLLARADAASAAPVADLAGRLAALNARAAALRGPVIDAATTGRMAAGVR